MTINKTNCIVCLIDDEQSVRKSMERLLMSSGFIVQTFKCADDFLNHPYKNSCGCIILDIAMPGINGMQLQEILISEGSHIPIIFLTSHADVNLGVEAMKKGALDFLIKPIEPDTLFPVVKNALAQCRTRYDNKIEFDEIQQRLSKLTHREKEVLDCIIGGAINREIAADLRISEKTVKIHRSNIMQKMNVSSPAELGHKCAKYGLGSKKLS